jgi:ceramide glucosyltransferase
MMGWLAVSLAALALAGMAYGLATIVAARRVMGTAPAPVPAAWPSVTLLKPLHGDEPGLRQNLESFAAQDYPGNVSIVLGAGHPEDAALVAAEGLSAAHPGRMIRIVADATAHGANRKVSNLVNIDREALRAGAGGEVVVLSDSDIRVAPDYLRTIVAALLAPGVGAISCLYRGRPAGGLWSRLSALGIDAHFLPNAALGIAYGLARPCFGSTIALRRQTLAEAGGLHGLADQLADDYALGEAVRGLGLQVAFPPVLVEHLCVEESFAALWSHELRWARTIRAVNPMGYAGSALTHPVGLALLAALASGLAAWSIGLLAAAIVLRLGVQASLQRIFGLERGGLALLPLRDLLSFAVFLWSFAGRSVAWRGETLDVARGGVLASPAAPKAGP